MCSVVASFSESLVLLCFMLFVLLELLSFCSLMVYPTTIVFFSFFFGCCCAFCSDVHVSRVVFVCWWSWFVCSVLSLVLQCCFLGVVCLCVLLLQAFL